MEMHMKKTLLISSLLLSGLLANTISVTGTVVSDNKKYIGARYMGYVKEVYVQIGDKVKREDTLFKMDSAEFDILKEQVNLDNNTFNFDDMNENLSITAEHTQSMLKAMQVIVKNAAQKVKEISVISHYLEVKAPSDGIIVQKNLHVGDMVMPGFPVMVLVDLDHLEIEAQISEADLLKVNEGDYVRFEIPSIRYKGHGKIKFTLLFRKEDRFEVVCQNTPDISPLFLLLLIIFITYMMLLRHHRFCIIHKYRNKEKCYSRCSYGAKDQGDPQTAKYRVG